MIDLPASEHYYLWNGGRTLRWHPDGAGLSVDLVDRRHTGPPVHTRLGLDGTLGEAVGPWNAESFDWCIDGRGAFTYRSNLFVIGLDGSRRRLTLRGAATPSWSPHCRWIAFERKGEIWRVDSRGGRPRRLTGRGGFAPAWSPDGSQIAFLRLVRGREGGHHVFALRLRGGPARQLSESPVGYPAAESPSYSVASPPEWRPLPR